MLDRHQHRVHCVLIAVVQQHDVPVPGAAVDHVQYFSAVLRPPVLCVHRPVHQRHGQCRGFCLRHQPVGRPYPVLPLPQQLPQQRVIFLQIRQRLRRRQAVQVRMVVGVVPHLMPLRCDALHDVRVLHRLTAHHEKRSLCPHLPQPVQQPRRTPGRWPVVKGQRHIFWIAGIPRLPHRRDHPCPAAGQQHHPRQQGANPSSHHITGSSICTPPPLLSPLRRLAAPDTLLCRPPVDALRRPSSPAA